MTVEEQAVLLSSITPKATQVQIEKIFAWVKMAMINESLVHLVMKGLVDVSWNDATDEPMFQINEVGKGVYNAI